MKQTSPSPVLAINGGTPVRTDPMPARRAIGEAEKRMISEVLSYYEERNEDPGYQGHFEARYCQAFIEMMGSGFADAVATGTAALFVAVAALDLPKGSEVLVSPITDPGTLSAIILNGLVPRLVDTQPGSYNIGAAEVEARIDKNTSAIVVVHATGRAAPIDDIVEVARKHSLKVLEDCSQAHGAKWNGANVGTFGDIAAFSTMYRKGHVTGGSGGVVYTRNESLYYNALAHADRGKPRWQDDFDDRNPNTYLFPALNFHIDEISCGIGLASLGRLPDTIEKRLRFVGGLDALKQVSDVCAPYGWSEDDSPFVYPIIVETAALTCDKATFAEAVRAEGIPLNPHYQYLVRDWPWIEDYLADAFDTPNARDFLYRSFNLFLNENYGDAEIEDIIAAILKIERNFL